MTELRLPEVNRVILSGRLTRDPDARYAGDGTPVTSLALAFHRGYRGRDGQYVEETGYVTARTYQRLAEVCGQRLKKGSPVLVEGRLQMREWNDRQGRRQTRLEIRAENVHFLERLPADAELPGLEAPQRTDEGGRAPS
jgi:single-strand DNA-binding protein